MADRNRKWLEGSRRRIPDLPTSQRQNRIVALFVFVFGAGVDRHDEGLADFHTIWRSCLRHAAADGRGRWLSSLHVVRIIATARVPMSGILADIRRLLTKSV